MPDNPDVPGSRTRRRWRPARRFPTFVLFAVVAAALLGTFTLIFATLDAERVQRSQSARTAQVLAALDGIVGATLNGETGQRGYLITYDERYLAPYSEGQTAYRAEMRRSSTRSSGWAMPSGPRWARPWGLCAKAR